MVWYARRTCVKADGKAISPAWMWRWTDSGASSRKKIQRKTKHKTNNKQTKWSSWALWGKLILTSVDFCWARKKAHRGSPPPPTVLLEEICVSLVNFTVVVPGSLNIKDVCKKSCCSMKVCVSACRHMCLLGGGVSECNPTTAGSKFGLKSISKRV